MRDVFERVNQKKAEFNKFRFYFSSFSICFAGKLEFSCLVLATTCINFMCSGFSIFICIGINERMLSVLFLSMEDGDINISEVRISNSLFF